MGCFLSVLRTQLAPSCRRAVPKEGWPADTVAEHGLVLQFQLNANNQQLMTRQARPSPLKPTDGGNQPPHRSATPTHSLTPLRSSSLPPSSSSSGLKVEAARRRPRRWRPHAAGRLVLDEPGVMCRSKPTRSKNVLLENAMRMKNKPQMLGGGGLLTACMSVLVGVFYDSDHRALWWCSPAPHQRWRCSWPHYSLRTASGAGLAPGRPGALVSLPRAFTAVGWMRFFCRTTSREREEKAAAGPLAFCALPGASRAGPTHGWQGSDF